MAHSEQEQLQIYIIICNVNHYEAPQPTNKLTEERVTERERVRERERERERDPLSPMDFIYLLKVHFASAAHNNRTTFANFSGSCADDSTENRLLR